jgi:hypothetical protein
MAICRFSDECDVYAFHHIDGYYIIYISNEWLGKTKVPDSTKVTTFEELENALQSLQKDGLKIPERVFASNEWRRQKAV